MKIAVDASLATEAWLCIQTVGTHKDFLRRLMMPHSFTLCSECLAQYQALVHQPATPVGYNFAPFGTLTWKDEHPERGNIFFQDAEHDLCRDSIYGLVIARNHLWKSVDLSNELKELWTEAQLLIPGWPGFHRLSLGPEQREMLNNFAAMWDE